MALIFSFWLSLMTRVQLMVFAIPKCKLAVFTDIPSFILIDINIDSIPKYMHFS